MTELKEDLDRVLRAVTFGEAPVGRAIREGRRLRTRRRVTVLAGALAVAVAAGYPSIARSIAGPPVVPATGPAHGPAPSHTAAPLRDPVITDAPPADVAYTGVIARGTIGNVAWSAALSGNDGTQAQTCFSSYVGSPGAAARSTGQLFSACAPTVGVLVGDSASDPARLTGGTGTANGNSTTYDSELGMVTADVTYLELTFTDGQQLKLIPATWQGRRYVAWVAPASMTIARLTAHLGGPHADSGQTATTVPYQTPDGLAVFGLWQKQGQAAPPRATGVIGGGVAGGRAWSETAYEGPWGTCFVDGGPDDLDCVPLARLTTTEAVGGWGGSTPGPAFGSAAPDVKTLHITLSDGTVVAVTPVAVGNERLFAFWIGKGLSPAGWTAYDAKGHQIGPRIGCEPLAKPVRTAPC